MANARVEIAERADDEFIIFRGQPIFGEIIGHVYSNDAVAVAAYAGVSKPCGKISF